MSNNFDRNFLPNFAHFSNEDTSTHDIRKHPFTKGGEHLVTTSIKLFTQYDLVVPLGVGS